jgi:hypothetical protein
MHPREELLQGKNRTRCAVQHPPASLVFLVALMFNTARQNCSAASAAALVCTAQTSHRRLLSRKSQNDSLRCPGCRDATNHVANTVVSIAGHSISAKVSIASMRTL